MLMEPLYHGLRHHNHLSKIEVKDSLIETCPEIIKAIGLLATMLNKILGVILPKVAFKILDLVVNPM